MKTSKTPKPVNYTLVGWVIRRLCAAVFGRRVSRANNIQRLLTQEREKRYSIYRDTLTETWSVWIDGEYIGQYTKSRAAAFLG